ncbi:MAG: putative metal-binding motif-containing protein [Saprospiraceae bacterium]
MKTHHYFLIFLLTNLNAITFSQGDRLTISKAERENLKCDLVRQYFEFKKYVRVLSDNSEDPRIRKANETALFRLLHPFFTMNDIKGGNRSKFISELRSNLETNENLKRTYETFDCPNMNLVSAGVSPDPTAIMEELKQMGITFEENETIKTTVYEGFMLFHQIELNSYNVAKSPINKSTSGIAKNERVKRIKFQIFKINKEDIVIKIKSIDDVTNSSVPNLVTKNKKSKDTESNAKISKKDSINIGRDTIIYRKPDPKKFVPCCDQRDPPDSDADGYNDLVDCDPFNPQIHPGALEIIGDGIDQNCDGVDQLGEDNDGDGYYPAACFSADPETRKKCDCNDDDDDIYWRKPNEPLYKWYNPANGWNDDNCDCVKDKESAFKWEPISKVDLFIPGKGHLIRGENKKNRITRFLVYSSVFTASATYGTLSYIQSQKYYKRHMRSETFRETNINYDKANNHHKRFIISTGIGALTFLGNFIHVKLLDDKERKLSKELFENYNVRPLDSKEFCSIKIVPVSDNGIGLALLMQF